MEMHILHSNSVLCAYPCALCGKNLKPQGSKWIHKITQRQYIKESYQILIALEKKI
jgi:hypothetical protein